MNQAIFFFFYSFAHHSVFFDGVIIFFAEIFPYLVIIAAGLFMLFHHDIFHAEDPYQVFLKKKKEIIKIFIPAALAVCADLVLKFLIAAPRPFVALADVEPLFAEGGFAFPSGHATFFMALGAALFFTHKKVGYIFIFFAVLIGLARIMAGVHFPVDILGGFILGALVAYLVKKI